MKNLIYYQQFNLNFEDLDPQNDNVVGIPDNTHFKTAEKMLKNYMKANNIKSAILQSNKVDEDGNDNLGAFKIIEL